MFIMLASLLELGSMVDMMFLSLSFSRVERKRMQDVFFYDALFLSNLGQGGPSNLEF